MQNNIAIQLVHDSIIKDITVKINAKKAASNKQVIIFTLTGLAKTICFPQCLQVPLFTYLDLDNEICLESNLGLCLQCYMSFPFFSVN